MRGTLRGVLELGAAGAILAALYACAPSPRPGAVSNYVICNATDCGDNVTFVLDNN